MESSSQSEPESSSPSPTVELLVASSRDEYRDHFVQLLEKLGGIQLVSFKSNLEMIDNSHLAKNPVLAIIDSEDKNESANEWLQNLRTTYPKCSAIVCYFQSAPNNIEELRKNGCDEIFHLYFDSDFIESHIAKKLPEDSLLHKVPITLLMPININDIDVNTELSFDAYVHLPTNKKTILLKKQGQVLDATNLEKFRQKNAQLYIKKSQLKKFMDYSVTVASLRGNSNGQGLFSQSEKIKTTMRDLFWQLLNNKVHQFQDGKAILDRALSLIAETELTKELPIQNMPAVFTEVCGSPRSVYNDVVGSSVLGNIICQILGVNPVQREATVLAALFHNIGLAKIGPFELFPGVEKINKEFRRYPLLSLQILADKKVPLSREILTAIEQHREHSDKTGFPLGPELNNLGLIPKILRLALRFQELTSLHSQMIDCYTPKSALAFLKTEAMNGPIRPHDLSMIMDLQKGLKFM